MLHDFWTSVAFPLSSNIAYRTVQKPQKRTQNSFFSPGNQIGGYLLAIRQLHVVYIHFIVDNRCCENIIVSIMKITCNAKSTHLTEFYLVSISVYKIYAYVYSEPCQTSNMKLFVKIVNSWKPLTISAKKFLLWCLTAFCMQD